MFQQWSVFYAHGLQYHDGSDGLGIGVMCYILDNIISFDAEGGLPSYISTISTSRIRLLSLILIGRTEPLWQEKV